MLDLDQLEAECRAASIDKSDLFDFYNKYWKKLVEHIKYLENEVIAEAQERW